MERELKRFVIDTLIEADNHTFEEAVAQKQAREPGISYDEAVDEVVADGCEMLLKSSEAIKKLCAENRSLGQKIQEFFAWLVEKLEGVFSDADPTHAEARILSEIKDAQRLWDMGLEAAAMSLKAERGTSRAEQYTAHAVSEARRALENELTEAEKLIEAAWGTGDADELSAALRARAEAEAKLSEADKQGKAQIETARKRAEREAKEARAKAIEEARQGVVKAENELERAYAAGVEILPYYERLLDAERELERMGLAPETIYGEEWDKAIPGIAAERARLVKLLEEKRINLEGYRAQVSTDKRADKMTLTVTAPNGETVRRRVNLKGRAATNALIAELIVEHRHGITAWSQETAQKNTADEGGKESFSMEERTEPYDYSKPFEQQIEDYLNGVIPEDDTLLIGMTPEILQKIGLLSLPLTINKSHLDYALKGAYNGAEERIKDHAISKEELAKLPEKIANPVAIIEDKQIGAKYASEYRVDIIIEMKINGKNTLIPIGLNTRGYFNAIEYDVNNVTTVHGNSDTLQRLANALNKDTNDNICVYYVNKEKTVQALTPTGNLISSTAKIPDGFVHKITDKGSHVKLRIKNITETQQFKRWFGDWQKYSEKASKIVNADGTPMVVYHQTENAFTVFDVKHKGAGTSDYGTPFGIFMKPTSANKSKKDDKFSNYYIINRPFLAPCGATGTDANKFPCALGFHSWWRTYIAHRILTASGEVFTFSKTKETISGLPRGVTVSGSLADATDIASGNSIRNTEEKNNPQNKKKESFSTEDSEGNELSPGQQKFFRDSKIRDEDGKLLVVYHGTDASFTVFDRTKVIANMDINDNIFVYYVNKEKTISALRRAGNPISGAVKIPDGYVHKITDKGSHVKPRIKNITETAREMYSKKQKCQRELFP